MANLKATPKSYKRAAEILAGRDKVKLGNNTWLETFHLGIAVRLHNTRIVVFYEDGRILLHTGGYRTVTTKDRINQFITGRVYQKAHQWFYVGHTSEGAIDWANPVKFEEGFNVAAPAPVVDAPAKSPADILLGKVVTLLKGRKHTGDSPSVRRRQHTEEALVLAAAIALLDAGYLLGVNDGEEDTLRHSRDINAVQKALFTTDEDYLLVYEDADQDDPLNVAAGDKLHADWWVRCIYGNDGYDVISDYCVALEDVIGEDTAVATLQQWAEEGII